MSRRVPAQTRKEVRERAKERCEYCRKPDEVGLYGPHVDHVIPPLHGGKDELGNYAWACFQCNSVKSGHVASYDFVTQELTPLYNPRTQQWHDHFELQGALIVGKTPVGRVTVRILNMNSPIQVSARQEIIAAGKW